MRTILFESAAFEDMQYWAKNDLKITFRKSRIRIRIEARTRMVALEKLKLRFEFIYIRIRRCLLKSLLPRFLQQI